MTASHADLIHRARLVARVENDERARRWLSTTCSILSDWGGQAATEILKGCLPSECLSGGGSSGRSWADAQRAARGDGQLALVQEAELRSRQPDPRNVAMMLLPLIGIVKDEIVKARGTAGLDAFLAAMPAALHESICSATAKAPYRYRLIDQSYARPVRRKAH